MKSLVASRRNSHAPGADDRTHELHQKLKPFVGDRRAGADRGNHRGRHTFHGGHPAMRGEAVAALVFLAHREQDDLLFSPVEGAFLEQAHQRRIGLGRGRGFRHDADQVGNEAEAALDIVEDRPCRFGCGLGRVKGEPGHDCFSFASDY